MDINGKSAIVTGGASGLGLATAQKLHELGARVVVLDLPSSNGEKAAAELGDRAAFVPADVTNEQEVQAAIERAVDMGPLSAVINCAGIGNACRVVQKDNSPFPLDGFTKIIDVNLIGTFNVIRLAAVAMVLNTPVDGEERGVIVSTASVAAFEGQIGQAAYSASKGGIVGMTLPVARDLAQHNIRVNTIAPGLFLTPLFQTMSDDAIAGLGAQVPHPARLGNPSEYAKLAVHIVDNAMINGEVIRLDGAIRMAPR
jgi:NAD(P)-dependent dehydrogenase (short-subunit alcohol dehydrogenase family)